MDCALVSNQILAFLKNKNVEDITIFDTKNKTKICKNVIVCTAPDCLFAKHLALEIKETFKKDIHPLHIDGLSKGEWVIVDYGDIIIHIFLKEIRSKYNIEKMWA